MNINKSRFSSTIVNFIILWFPVFPFVAYWIIAYLQFNFGKYYTPSISWGTHFFIVSFFVIFVAFYKLGIRYQKEPKGIWKSIDDKRAISLLKTSSWLLFIGTLIFVYDRLSSGAGSFDMVQNELALIREESSDKTTFLTTIAVIPQSFKIIAIASYFYVLDRKLKVPKHIHLLIISTIALEIINMVLSANRGSLFWIISYIFFYFIYIKRLNPITELLSKKYLTAKLIISALILVSYSYFVWVAENRVASTTAEYLGQEAYLELKNPSNENKINYSRLGGEYQIFYYLTHGFHYTDAIFKHAPIVNFDLISPLGIRVESQLQRFLPNYQHPAKSNILIWLELEGLNPSGWPSIFGASLAYFGIIGALLFSSLIGYFSGYSVRRWLKMRRLGWLIIVLLIFSSLNMSFDWILRDFNQFMALFIGAILIIKKRKY